MTTKAFEALACPLDGEPLYRESSSWRCANGHNFDVARQGYVHLLPVQKKRSKDPGDSKEMVAARQRFLGAGYYQPIAGAVSAAVLKDVSEGSHLDCLDAGCGEGYYLRQLASAADGRVSLAVLGLDISKWAVLAAARRDRAPSWVVGSNANLPVQPASLDRVLCMFGFPVDAGQDHLRELREIIYPQVRAESKKVDEVPEGFRRVETQDLRFTLHLEGAEPIADLLAMTPHLYRASAEGRARAAQLEGISLTVDVCLQTFERYAPAG